MLFVYEVICNVKVSFVEIIILVMIMMGVKIFELWFIVVFIFCVGFGMFEGFVKLLLIVEVGFFGMVCDEMMFELMIYVEWLFDDLSDC